MPAPFDRNGDCQRPCGARRLYLRFSVPSVMALPPASDGGASSCTGAATGNVEPSGTSAGSRYRPTNDDLPPTWHMLHPAHGGPSDVRTLAELRVVSFLRAVKEKPGWTAKVADDTIVARWTAEALAAGGGGGGDSNASAAAAYDAVHEGDPPAPLTPGMLAAAISELRADAARCADMPGGAMPSGVELVWLADGLVSPALAADVVGMAAALEARSPPDWHPGSDGRVRDLLHPSLYCYVATVSRRRPTAAMRADVSWGDFLTSGAVEPPSAPSSPSSRPYTMYRCKALSETHLWLASSFGVDPDTAVVETLSHYINGLHPVDEAPAYGVIERLLAAMLPLFEAVLTDTQRGLPHRYPVTPWSFPETPDEPEPVYSDFEEEDAGDDRFETALEAWRRRRIANLLPALLDEQAATAPPPHPPRIRLAGRRLRAIIKVARIELTPDRPTYPGGTWHMEGVPAEAIAATGIYYYEIDNIEGSRLAFRTAVDNPEYEQGDDTSVRVLYGLVDGASLNQPLGSVATDTAGRMLAFPNMLHRVSPFRLADPTRPGRRSIVAIFLVDPTLAADSAAVTADTVPPHQAEWLAAELASTLPAGGNHIGALPTELLDGIVAATEDWMSPVDARRHREALMAMRSARAVTDNEELFEAEFSLCEH